MQKKWLLMLTAVLIAATNSASAVDKRTENNGQLVLEDIPTIPPSIIEELNRYQNVRSASFRGWDMDGTGIYVSTRFGEVDQLHKVETAGGARRQLTFFDEPIGSIMTRPEHRQLAFTMDVGGNEYAQIFLFDAQSGSSEMITDGQSRNGAILWNKQGSAMAYQSTRRDGKSNDIWLTTFADGQREERLILQSEDGSWWGPSAFSQSGSQLLVMQYISSTRSKVHLLTLDSGELSLLAGDGEKDSRNFPAGFSYDGGSVYVVSDRGGEFTQLIRKDLSSGNETVITADIPWDISSFTLSEDGRRGAFVANENGISSLYLYEPRSDRYHKVDSLPIGVIGGIKFNPKGDKLALSLNTPKTPTDSFVLELNRRPLSSGDLTRWTFSEVGGLNTEYFVEPKLIHYPTFDQENDKPRKIPAFVYKPRNPKGPVPVIISIHGGPEGQYRPVFSSKYQLWLEKLGVAVIAPNVRGSAGYGKSYLAMDNGYEREGSVKDIGALLDWIATQPDLDAERVAVFGGSYGGYMVLASSVYYSDRLKAAVDIVGISNFVTFLTNTKSYRRDLRRVEYGDERDPQMRAFLEKISPNNHVEKIQVPMFVVQGQNDPRVPVTEAEQIVAALRKNGNQVWYMNALNGGHGYRKKENNDAFTQATALFFAEHLLTDEQREKSTLIND
ncbi:prolyl oligopeptidase family serine peptidase [Microbulbifer sp. OS29]|uniref:Prolyl oligopeptidase family serine peptidase n=1 Tax=Microbulbifer okhotskensis TaxID=2926617 RepID=A0A9X2ESL8_9GAMM|nr:prolyl oligopeptidase family serine peptidase [Microbulbifer okhotskensis]MCO1334848.1 prolyl oligopeptidase family serine peptidase [Microbulbifer okhotskensis]